MFYSFFSVSGESWRVPSHALACATGPRRLWQRELGEGYSAIAAEGGMLFTMYRKGENEIVIALDAATGKTVWEYSYAAPFSPEYDMSNGSGPHATPLVTGNLVFTSGATGKLHCFDKRAASFCGRTI